MLLKEFLVSTISYWDLDGTPPNVRENFWKIIKCGTIVLGAEIFAGPGEVKVVCHTCKSRFCPSCGAREGAIWQEKVRAAIPEMKYQEINFTMPQEFWPLFQQNRHLLNDLPALGARAIEYWAKARYGARVILMVVQQTYGGLLNFYPHLHTLVSAGGLDESRARWINSLEFNREEHRHELMLTWQYALLRYLDSAIGANAIRSDLGVSELRDVLLSQAKRWWNTFVGRKVSKAIVIEHIGRYIRKPPIAQYRLTRLNENEVQYLAWDTKQRRQVPIKYTNREFLALLIPHVADRYSNSMRYFGLLAPRSKNLLPILFDLLKRRRQAKPARLPWAKLMQETFGKNPLIGRDGSLLRRVGRI